MLSAFCRMSRLAEESARRMSITISCSTLGCCLLRSCNLSSTMSLMLLSDWEESNCVYDVAAARMAVAEEDRATSADAHLQRVELKVQ